MNAAKTRGVRRIQQATGAITGLGVAVAAAAIGLSTLPDDSSASTAGASSQTSVTSQTGTSVGSSTSDSSSTSSNDSSSTSSTGLSAAQAAPVAHSAGS